MSLLTALSAMSALVTASPEDGPKVTLGAFLQPQLLFYPGDKGDYSHDGFSFRRARPVFQAEWGKWAFKFVPDFAGGKLRLQDVFLDYTLAESACGELTLRVGKDKPPIAQDLLQSSSTLLFLERSAVAQLSPDRDIGIALLGAYGILNGHLMLGNGSADLESMEKGLSDSVELYARLGVDLNTVAFGISSSIGWPSTTDGPQYRTIGRRDLPVLAEGTDDPISEGQRWRLGGYLRFVSGPMLLWAEAIHSHHSATQAGQEITFADNLAWTFGMSVLLNNPKANAWNKAKAPGSLELATRVGQMLESPYEDINGDIAMLHLGLGVSWTIDEHLRLIASYDYSGLSGDTGGTNRLNGQPDEHLLGIRLQANVLKTL